MSVATPASLNPTVSAADMARSESRWERIPVATLALTALLLAFIAFPRIYSNPRLTATFVGVAGGLLVWQLVLWWLAERGQRALRIEWVKPVKAHYIQALVQSTIFVYWGMYWSPMYAQLPLILPQLIFLYIVGALLSWSREKAWRPGFGPVPIIISTSFFMWFQDNWFIFQFLMVLTGALGKEFITWKRDGRTTHIFNPSSFGLTVWSLLVIFTGTTRYTYAPDLATTIEAAPYILILIFLVGLVVQYYFAVTLMTLAAVTTVCLLNIAYTYMTGVYQFANTHLAAAVLLGMHLLITDPATSPRSNVGKVIFGMLYAIALWILYDVLGHYGVPELYNKLLPVPILNLLVQAIDWVARSGVIGRFNQRWETGIEPRRMNYVHMACWATLFFGLIGSGFLGGRHPGDSVEFWKQALAEGKPQAGRKLVLVANAHAVGGKSGAAWNEMGLIHLEGKHAKQDTDLALICFSTACELGDLFGCANEVGMYLFKDRHLPASLPRALDRIEQECGQNKVNLACFLIGLAYETGLHRPQDPAQALAMYEQSDFQTENGLYVARGVARIVLAHGASSTKLEQAVAQLRRASDSESFWYLAHLYHRGLGVQQDSQRAAQYLEAACKLGLKLACDGMKMGSMPAYQRVPQLVVPKFTTTYVARPQ